jgi:hypothetical protein
MWSSKFCLPNLLSWHHNIIGGKQWVVKQHYNAIHIDSSIIHIDSSIIHIDSSIIHIDSSIIHIDSSIIHIDSSTGY